MPVAASTSNARSASDSTIMRSTSWSLALPPLAQAAKPPPTANGMSASRRAAAAFFRLGSMATSCSSPSSTMDDRYPSPGAAVPARMYTKTLVYPRSVTKHLIDVDDELLGAARAQLGTRTIKDTVNEALRRATHERERHTAAALDVLAGADLDDRVDAWR